MTLTSHTVYRNAADAFLGELGRVVGGGTLVTPRGEDTKELIGEAFSIRYPLERFIVLPHRKNNPFAAIAESVWVLAGRNDIAFLRRYLPRAPEFSDDGSTWRAGYGRRLRNWEGVDQVGEVLRVLTANPSSRRAVMSIFDPKVDFAESRDIPCNNWLHWIVRDGSLDLAVAVRSNDIMWGFSQINTFEWSLLQECMAHWLGARVGRQHWFVSSMHLYERHWEVAEQILSEGTRNPNTYALPRRSIRFETPFADIEGQLALWFELESVIRHDPCEADASVINRCGDPLLRAFLVMLRAFWLLKAERPSTEIVQSLAELTGTDLHAAAMGYLSRSDVVDVLSTRIQDSPLGDVRVSQPFALNAHIARLHADKGASYGNSWKRRGELIGILANIARKVDRLENVMGGAPEGDESIFETAKDAFVYSLKYCTYLLDLDSHLKVSVLGEDWADVEVSEGTPGFDALLAGFRQGEQESAGVSEISRALALALSTAEALATNGAPVAERLAAAERLSQLSFVLTSMVAPDDILVGHHEA